MDTAQREQILAFRLATHHLTSRLDASALVDAAASCGIQETPTGSAALAFAARVEDVTPESLQLASAEQRALVTLWSVRGAPYVVPTAAFDAFSVGALPLDGPSFRRALGGWATALAEAGLDPFETLDQLVAAAWEALDGRRLNVNDLRDELFASVPGLAGVSRPAGAHADMPEPLFRAIGARGVACIVAGRGTDAELARTDHWLGGHRAEPDRAAARAELARRFLHGYGPATPQQFADWTQRSPRDAKDALAAIADELVEVAVDGRPAWLLRRDEEVFASPPQPRGARLLPPQDPFLQQRDRATLLSDEAARRQLWRPVRGPGGVLVDGEVVGTWRSRTARSRVEVTVEPFGVLPRQARGALEAEAERLAAARGAAGVEVAYTD